jgi:predicted Zn-dependent protease
MRPFAAAQDERAPSSPIEKEIALGRSLAAELEAAAGPLDDAVAVAFIEDIVQRLAEASGTKSFFTVRVLDSRDAAAHALPGGFLLVRSGLVVRAETVAEFAAVLAHEIAHIAAGHGLRNASESREPINAASVPLIFLGGWTGACARIAPGSAAPLAWLKAAGRNEDEADLLALSYMEAAGYDPNGLADVYDRLSVEGIPQAARMTSAVRDQAREYASSGRTHVTTSSRFVEVRDRLWKSLARHPIEEAPSLFPPATR